MPCRDDQRHLLLQQLFDLVLDDLLVEKLATGDAVDLGAQGGDPVFIFMLHARLAGHGATDQIVAQDEIGGRREIADGEKTEDEADGERRHPGLEGHVANLVAACQNDDVLLRAFAENPAFRRHQLTPERAAILRRPDGGD